MQLVDFVVGELEDAKRKHALEMKCQYEDTKEADTKWLRAENELAAQTVELRMTDEYVEEQREEIARSNRSLEEVSLALARATK